METSSATVNGRFGPYRSEASSDPERSTSTTSGGDALLSLFRGRMETSAFAERCRVFVTTPWPASTAVY